MNNSYFHSRFFFFSLLNDLLLQDHSLRDNSLSISSSLLSNTVLNDFSELIRFTFFLGPS